MKISGTAGLHLFYIVLIVSISVAFYKDHKRLNAMLVLTQDSVSRSCDGLESATKHFARELDIAA
ncbi:MAG: hypothetical protein IPL65_05065 [Lewinellaceae bacterium]|nr:hypothetical protein [Lewinellaceae bacterium]